MKAAVVNILIVVGLLATNASMANGSVQPAVVDAPGFFTRGSSPSTVLSGRSIEDMQPVMHWYNYTVDDKGSYSNSIVLDKENRPHISYPANTPLDTDLTYAYWTGSQWHIEVVDYMLPVESTGHPVLKLDSDSHPHIGYDVCNMYSCSLYYAHWTGSQWTIQPIDAGISGNSISLSLDESDQPHLSYCRQHDSALEIRYATWRDNQWFTETIDENAQCWYSTSIDIDSSGRPHISYYNSTAGDLMYVHWTGSQWITHTVDGVGYVGNSSSLMLDSGDNPHIGYFDWSNESLKYGVWSGSGWDIQTVDNAGSLGSYTSLILDDQDHPHMTYTGAGNNTIKYTHWTGSEWFTYSVDSGLSSWLALDSANQPHISYWNDGLDYAWGQVLAVKMYLPAVMSSE